MIEDQNDIFDSRVKFHDRHRFEIKLDIDLDAGLESAYSVETYFFVPKALNIGPHSYSKENFYNDIQRYIRFKTPKVSLLKLCDPSLDTSPIKRIREKLSLILAGSKDRELVKTVYDEFKLLGCVIRGETRDHAKMLIESFETYGATKKDQHRSFGTEALDPKGRSQTKQLFVPEALGNFLEEIKQLTTTVSMLRSSVADPAVPTVIKETFAFFDEYFSLIIEEYLTSVLEALRKNVSERESFKELESELVAVIVAQGRYRAAMNYPSVLADLKGNEVIIYRRGVLKKFISSVLYLKTAISEWQALTQVLFSMAAGVAMLFAVLVTFYVQNRYTINSLPFLLAVVISYMFKDRIKDWLKVLFSKNLTRWISDRKISILDPSTGERIGILKEAFTFMPERSVPADISRLRRLDNITSIDEDGKPERVFKYKKEIRLYPERIRRHHNRLKDLNDIMRFSIENFIKQADDPFVDYPVVDPVSGEVSIVPCPRVYHVNLVLKYVYASKNGRESMHYDRIRIVLNKDGIRRIEEVQTA
ncbi:MAG TPA: hypothetical protein DCL44_09910 [Elusimicrobia bacterium]|nr:hypothetical protein [Elusimicrobiota bacterium]